MLKIENFEEFIVEGALRGMRNHLNTWDKSNPNTDLDAAKRLCKAGILHRKYLRQVMGISADITAPLYWWNEFDTYKAGTVSNSCSIMHTIHKRDLTVDDFSTEYLTRAGSKSVLQDVIDCINLHRQVYVDAKVKENWHIMIQLLPSSYNQMRTVTMSYENVANIIEQQKNYKLDEWHQLIDALKAGTYIENIIND